MRSGNCGRHLPMTDPNERDEEIAAIYRGLPPETPPSGIDAAIVAAARSSVASSGRRNWVVPVSLAAVLVLAVAVTLRMEHERPGVATMEVPAPQAKRQPSPRSQPVAPAPPSQPQSEAKPVAPVEAPPEAQKAP